ncbi:MAG: ATP-binding protein, partial [Oscillospiraceae bacterium]|nr:ATP-binding protein [Oscillospiraceae bacterium]
GIDKNAYIDEFADYKLLIIDDLGAERESSYALEQVYNVLNERYKNGQPLIITTNLTLDEMKNPKNMGYQRIYDRVLELCVPIHFKGESIRKDIAKGNLAYAKVFLAE